MTQEDLKFGTSGVRGRVVDFTFANCRNYALGFVELLQKEYPAVREIFMARDLRESSPEIQFYFAHAFKEVGFQVTSLGEIPTPALAYFAQIRQSASVMVTGSHIPADRNGVKFYTPDGEITKDHEVKIREGFQKEKALTARNQGSLLGSKIEFPNENENQMQAEALYTQRYVKAFGKDFLKGLRVLFYQHSTVGRQLLPKILQDLGADVKLTGFSDVFIPVDTENVHNLSELQDEMFQNDIEILISADGDADRPLVVHHRHGQITGDLLGMITAQFLGIKSIAVPVSCTSLIEESTWFHQVGRTKIGSPYVVAEMANLSRPQALVAGFEANGGFLLGSDLKNISALPTRDALLPMIIYLKQVHSGWIKKHEDFLFSKINLSGLLKEFPLSTSKKILEEVGAFPVKLIEFSSAFRRYFPAIKEVNQVDGVKILSDSGATVHLRPSGNAPEFRVYVEARDRTAANEILKDTLIFCEGYRG